MAAAAIHQPLGMSESGGSSSASAMQSVLGIMSTAYVGSSARAVISTLSPPCFHWCELTLKLF